MYELSLKTLSFLYIKDGEVLSSVFQYFNNNIDLSSEKKMDKVVLQIISRHSGSINLQ